MTIRAHILVPLTKIDLVQRLVYGEMTSEAPDKSREIMDYDSSKPYFEGWTGAISKATEGRSLGNLRAMHQPVAAGKLTEMEFDDPAKKIRICAKVVDDAEWAKVEEGVYTGFSIGGSYVKKWTDPENPTLKRYTVDPVEVSLVDNPCNPTAHFTAIKAGGLSETRLFKSTTENMHMDYEPTNEEVAARAAEMAKAAGKSLWADFVAPAAEALKAEHAALHKTTEPEPMPEAAPEPVEAPAAPADTAADAAPVEGSTDAPAAPTADKAAAPDVLDSIEQVWKTPDGTTFVRKVDAIAHITAPPASDNPVAAALAAVKATLVGEVPAPEGELAPGLTAALKNYDVVLATHSAVPEDVRKGMYNVREFADVIASLRWVADSAIYERCYENDGSSVPSMILDGLRTLGAALVTMVTEEVAEMLAELQATGVKFDVLEGAEGSVVELAAEPDGVSKLSPSLLEKVGARNAKRDQASIQRVHDEAVTLGAACLDEAGKAIEGEDLQKMADTNPVIKALLADRTEDREALVKAQTQIAEAVAGIAELGEMVKSTRADLEKMGKQPAPRAPLTHVVEKGVIADGSTADPTELAKAVSELMKTPQGQSQLADIAIRAAQQNGTPITK